MPKLSCICRLFSSVFSVKFIPHQFNGIHVCWLSRPRHQLKDVPFLFAFNVHLAEFSSILWVFILHEYKSLSFKPRSRWDRMMLQYAVIAGLIQFANHWLCNWQKPPHIPASQQAILQALCLVWFKRLQLFLQRFQGHQASYLTRIFRTLICQFKGLNSTILSSSLCAAWSTGAFKIFFCFFSGGFLTVD